jgi:hypothetical protein
MSDPGMERRRKIGEFAQKVEQSLGIIPGTKVYTPFPFSGVNLQDQPPAIDDKEFSYMENFFRLGNGYLRTGWDVSLALYTAPGSKTILPYFFWYNIGQIDYVIVFFTDGTAVQVEQDNGVVTPVTTVPGTFYITSGSLPICSQSGSQYLLIGNNNHANDYWIWDGKLLYGAGTASPFIDFASIGSNYNSVPTITAYGGTGSGMTFSATVQGGGINTLVVSNPGSGYGIGDVVQLRFQGGGSDNSPVLVANLTPTGVAAIAVTNAGNGYTSPPAVNFAGGGGAGAAATAVISGGVNSINITNIGTQYTFAGVVISGGGGTGASAIATVLNGSVVSISITSPGAGYTSTPTVTITGDGFGATAVAVVNFGVTSVTVTAPGAGYTSAPVVTFSGGGGTGASATALLKATSVASVSIVDGGTGFGATAPNILFVGGGGSGATGTVTVAAGAINTATVATGGSGYTNAPAVVVSAGQNASAYASVELMPFGVSGNCMETFNSRVWLGHPFQNGPVSTGGDFLVSAPGSLVDFSSSSGGVIFVNSDRFLRKQYNAFRQSNGYLYMLGDSSVSVVSNVQVSTTTGIPTTTFTYQNTDPQVGCAFRDSCDDYGRTILFANRIGVYGLYGGAVTEVSKKIVRLFNTAIFPPDPRAFTPAAAVAHIFHVKYYFCLLTIQDPEGGDIRTVMVGWNENDWGVFSQTVDLKFIGTQEVNSECRAWGTDGKAIYPLFGTPSDKLLKRFTTKYYGTDQLFILKDFLNLYLQAQDLTDNQEGVAMSVDMIASGIAVQPDNAIHMDQQTVASTDFMSFTYADMLFQQPVFPAPPPFFPVFGTGTGGFTFSSLAARFLTTSSDFALSNLMIAYLDNTAYQ